MSRLLFVLLLAGCATAGQSTGDAPRHGDGPQSGDGGRDSGIDTPPGSCATPTTGMIATWSFVGEPGSQTSTAASGMASGITAGAVSRAAGLAVASGVGSINSSGWATGASLDSGKYYTFSVTPPSGCLLDLSTLAIDSKSSGTGPAIAVAATSADGFGSTSPVSVNSAGTTTLSVSGQSGMVEVRVFGYSASSASGTYRIQNTLTLSGALH